MACCSTSTGAPDASTAYTVDTLAGSPSRSDSLSPLVRGPLPPARYVTTRFAPEFTVEVPAAWQLVAESPTAVEFAGSGANTNVWIYISDRSSLSLARDPVYEDMEASTLARSKERSLPDGVSQAVQSLPLVTTAVARPLRAFGEDLPTTVVTSSVEGELRADCTAAAPCIAVPFPSGALGYGWNLTPGESVTFAEHQDLDITIMVGGFVSAEQQRTAAAPLLASVQELPGR